MLTFIAKLTLLSILILVVALSADFVSAQIDGGGGIGGGDGGFGGGDLEGQILDAVDTGGGVGGGNTTGDTGGNVGGGTGGDTGTGIGDIGDLFDMEVEVTPDVRNMRGFIGVSVMDPDNVFPEFRFIGPRSTAEAGGNANAGRAPAGGRNAGGGTGATNGVEIQRQTPIRTRIVPRFSAPTLAPNYVASRVNRRLSTLPATQQFSNSMNVSMQGRTAVITGTALNQQQVNRISRQLRFEPGVSRVVNRVSVNQ